MVADTFKIFIYHQHVCRILAAAGIGAYGIYQLALDLDKELVHYVVVRYDLPRLVDIPLYICLDSVQQHDDCLAAHPPYIISIHNLGIVCHHNSEL